MLEEQFNELEAILEAVKVFSAGMMTTRRRCRTTQGGRHSSVMESRRGAFWPGARRRAMQQAGSTRSSERIS